MAPQQTPLTPSPAHAPLAVTPKPPSAKKPAARSVASMPFWIGLGVSLAWVGVVIAVISNAGTSHSIGGVALGDWALGISAAVSPVAMIWMITAYLQRAADIQTIADPLRRQLTLITGESGAADARIRRFNEAIREQIDLLRSAQTLSQEDLEAVMDRVQQHRADLERFENVSTQQVKEIQDVVRRSMFQIEQMMDDKFTMLRVLDGKLQQDGEGVANKVETVGIQVAKMLEDIENTSGQVADALQRAEKDAQKLSDTSRLQESSLTSAATAAAETLGGLSSKIDLSVARFLERASSAREEADRLAQSLDAQTRALDDFSSTLPVRVTEAESVLRGVADRLYACEQLARDQAVNLSDKLSHQIDGLQSFMERFTSRLIDVDSGLDRRRNDLTSIAERLDNTTSGFFGSWEKSIGDLSDRMGNSLLKFTVVNDETRRNAEAVTAHLNETTGKYEDVVARMHALTDESGSKMKGMTAEIASQLSQFETLSAASNKAGEEVQSRANAALENLQHVLDRVLAARDATQTVGQTLVKDINDALSQNEKMLHRLSETSQIGARAISAAADNLGRQEGELSAKARANEAMLIESVQRLQQQSDSASKSLREQTAGLMTLLAEAQSQLIATDQKLQAFASQAVEPVQKAMEKIDASADQGLRTLGTFGQGLSTQVDRLQEFHVRIGNMSKEMGKTTSEAASSFETINERFSGIRAAQEEAARRTLAQFSETSERLQREVSGLDSHAAQALELLQQAALMVGEQSHQMMEKARESGVQIKNVASALQTEAEQIQAVIRQQTAAVSNDLGAAEKKFSDLNESIREKTEAAHALLDRTAAHYQGVSERLNDSVDTAHAKVEVLQSALTREADQIAAGAARIETQADEITSSSRKAIDNLSILDAKLAETHDLAVDQSAKTLTKLDEASVVFQDRTASMTSAALMAVDAIAKTGITFDTQSVKLKESGEQIATVLTTMTAATDALAEKASAIRTDMEEQQSRLLAQLTDAVSHLDVTGNELRHIASTASEGADQASLRFATMTESTAQRIDTAVQDLHAMADRAETSLSALGVNVTQQAATLAVVGDQIGEQQRVLAEANEKQRVQMLDLFDRLNAAHTQASEVAERSISYLKTALTEIDHQVGEVGDRSQAAVGNIKMASMGFSDQSTLLLQNAKSAEEQARSVLQVTSALQEQAAALSASLQAESERAGEHLASLLGRLATSGNDVRNLGSSTGTVFTTLQRAMTEQASELNSTMDKIAERQRTLTLALDAQRETINNLLNRLTTAQDQTAAAAERAAFRLNEGTVQITQNVGLIDARAQDALNSVQKASAGFAYETESIEKQAKQAVQDAQDLLVSASGMREQIGELRNSMREEGDTAHAVLGALVDKIKAGAEDLRDLSATTQMALGGLGENIAQQSIALTATMGNIDERQTKLAAALNAQGETIEGLLGRLVKAQNETASSAEQGITRLTESAQVVEQHIGTFDARTQEALKNIQVASEGFAKEAEAIDFEAKQAEQQARAVLESTAGLHHEIFDLRTSMQNEGAQSSEALGSLIARITSGSSDLRNAGATTEEMLASLQHVLDEKIVGLSVATQKIGDRQQTLNGALEAQRETIDGLLARFAQAQEETAALAERTASRLNEEAQSITNSIDSIGAQASTTLTTVQASVKGFTEQASVISAQSQQAEQQVRNMMTVTSGMQAQSKHLRDAMESETGRVIELLSGVISKLDFASGQLKTQSAEATEALENTATRLSTVSQVGSDLLATQTQGINQAVDQAEARMNQTSETARTQMRLVGEFGDKAEAQAQQLANAAEFATTRLAALRDSIGVSDQRGSEVATSASGRIEQIKALLQAQMEHLVECSEKAAERVSAAAQSLGTQSDAMRANLESSESALNIAADGLRIEAQQLPATLNRSMSSVDAATRTLKAQAAETDQTLIGTADRFISVTADVRTNISEEMKRVSDVADDAGKVLNGFAQLLAEQVASMQQSTAMLSGEQKDLVEKANIGIDALSEASQRLLTLRSEASGTAERLVHEFDMLDQRAATTGGRLAQAGEGIAKQVEAIAQATMQAETGITRVSDTMREQLDRIRGGLQGQIDDISRGLLQITAQLERTGANLRSTAVGAVADVERVGQRFEETGAAATAQVNAETNKMLKATEEVAGILAMFSDKFDQMIDHMAQAGDDIKHQEGNAIDHMQRMLGHLGTIAERLENARTMSGDVSKQAVERLDQVVNAVHAQMNKMTSGAQTAAGILRGISQIYDSQTSVLSKGVGDTHMQVMSMNKSIDDMQQRTDRMRAALKMQGEDLMNSLRQILAQLEMTGDGLSEAVSHRLHQQAISGAKKAS